MVGLRPTLWKTAVYLWNYCEAEWDLTWEHQFRYQRADCGALDCAYWGPAIELFGNELYPDVPELGYADSLFIHDGVRSELTPDAWMRELSCRRSWSLTIASK